MPNEREASPLVVSFDIDGTMEFGHPSGPIMVGFVRAVAASGHVIGSASDRTVADQSALWSAHDLEVAFDTDVDAHYARLAGFEYVGVQDPTALGDGRLRLLSGGVAHDAS